MKPGDRFGRLTVVNLGIMRFEAKFAHCVCDCGLGMLINELNLIAGKTQSCGGAICQRRIKQQEQAA